MALAPDLPAKLEHLRLRDLLILERVNELGSLRQVAESMHLTQPAVTLALQGLEDAFSAQLVVRSSGGASLSPIGRALLDRLKAVRQEAAAAFALAREPEPPAINLGLSQIAAMSEVVAGGITRFMAAHPDLRLGLREDYSPELWRLLAEGAVDAVVCRMLPAEQIERLGDRICRDVLATERMVLVTAADHPLLAGPITKERLGRELWALPPANSSARLTLNEWFVRAGLVPPVATVISESFHTNLRLAARARLLTLAPESTFTRMQQALGLAVVPVDCAWSEVPYVFACRKSSLANPHLQELRRVFGLPAS